MLHRIAASPSRTLLALTSTYLGATFVHAWDERRWLDDSHWLKVFIFLTAVLVMRTLLMSFPRMRESASAVARLVILVFLMACGAFWRFESALPDPRPLPAGTEHRGTVVREPVYRDSKYRLTAGNVRADGRKLGLMYVTSRDAFGIREGDDLAWRCRAPRADADPRDAIFCDADGAVRVTGHGWHPLLMLRARLRAAVRALLPEPEASLQLGLLVGDRGGLPRSLIEDFRSTGTTHVLAVSGYNVSLVAEALVVMFALLGLARRRAALAVIACVVGFAGLAGADPPVVRAALMGSAGLVAASLGRRANPVGALLLAAALMLYWDPQALRHDVAFRLSFAAVMGLGAFGKPFAERLTFIPIDGIRSALGETLGATVATLPIMLYDFGSLSVSSPVTNVMIAPLIPFATAVGGAAAILAMIFVPLGMIPASAAGAALRLMREVVSWWAAAVPSLSIQIGALAAFALYLPIVFLWIALRDKERI